jgi:hypothetical protein
MGDSYRHHHASRDGPIVVLVPIPFGGGSPKPVDPRRPPAYPHQKRDHWQPRTKPPTKAERVIEFMRRVQKQDNEVRAFMRSAGAST